MMTENVSRSVYPTLQNHARLQERWERLQRQYELETREEEKMRMEPLLEECRLEWVLSCRQEASRMRGKGAFREALGLWEQIQPFYPDPAQAGKEVAALERLNTQQAEASQLRAALSRIRAIRPVFPQLVKALQQPADTAEYLTLRQQVEFFLTGGEPDPEGFMAWWESEYVPPQDSSLQILNMATLANKVRSGNTALFIGSGIGAPSLDSDLVSQLAARIGYEGFAGSLSAIAEYYHLHPNYGPNALLQELRSLLPDSREVRLYKALAQLPESLVVVTAVYDNLLEAALLMAGKRFVELSSLVKPGIGHGIGHLLVSFSDQSQSARVCTEEELSSLRLLDQGYSVIYRLRGNCIPPEGGGDTPWRDALTLAESHYFNFARHADRIVPDYLARLLHPKGLLFVGYRPLQWEERLLAHALLEKRQHAEERAMVVSGAAPEPLEAAFWKKKNVDFHIVDMQELDHYLSGSGL